MHAFILDRVLFVALELAGRLEHISVEIGFSLEPLE
jgi:hypothetical protein